MRAVILIAAAALSLAACRNNDQADNTANVDENLSAENVVSNDVTAIDAVTGEDANMAADVNHINAGDLNADATANGASPTRKHSQPKPSANPAISNSSAAAASNNAL